MFIVILIKGRYYVNNFTVHDTLFPGILKNARFNVSLDFIVKMPVPTNVMYMEFILNNGNDIKRTRPMLFNKSFV